MLVVALLAVKGQEDQAEHVERGEQRGQQTEGVQNMSAIFRLESGEKDGVLGKEAREERRSGDGQRGGQHRQIRPANLAA